MASPDSLSDDPRPASLAGARPSHFQRPAEGNSRRDFLVLAFKHWWVIGGCFVIVSAIVWWGIWKLPKTYVADAKILVRLEQQGAPSFLSGIAAYREPRDVDSSGRKLETEIGLLSARPAIEAVVREMNLRYDQVHHAPYVHLLNPLVVWWAHVKAWYLDMPAPTEVFGFDDTVKEFGRALEVKADAPKGAESSPNIIEITLRAPDPEIARRAVQSLATAYIDRGSSLDRASGREALEIVRARLEEARARVDAIDGELRQQLASSGMSLSDVAQAGTASPASEPAAMRAEGKPTSRGMGAGAESGPAGPPATDGSLLRALRFRLAEAEIDLAAARAVYTDRSDRVATLAATVNELRRRVREESIRGAGNQVRLKALLRQAAVAENAYIDLQKKADQIALFLEMEPTQAFNRSLVEPPALPRTSEWRKSAIAGIAASLAGLMFGVMLAAIREYFDHRLDNPAAAEAYLQVEVLGTIPDVEPAVLRRAMAPDDPGGHRS